MNIRTINRREVSDRTPLGQFVKWSFVGFNVLMLLWITSAIHAAGNSFALPDSRADLYAEIGLVAGIWLVGGGFLGTLTMVTRRTRIIEIEPGERRNWLHSWH